MKPPAEQTLSRERWQQTRQDANHFLALFDQMDRNLAGRMRMLRYIHDISRVPRSYWSGALQGMRPDHASMVSAILRQLVADPEVGKRVKIALDRFDEAAKAAQLARAFVSMESTLDAENVQAVIEMINRLGPDAAAERRRLMKDFDLADFKRKLFLLTTLDLLFTSDAVLNQMFPAQERKAQALQATGVNPTTANEKPPSPTPRPVQALPNPPPGENLLSGLMRKIKGDA